MLIKINSENIKKLKNGGKRAAKLVLSGALILSLLTGCNRTVFDTKYGFDKALILGDDTSIIMNVKEWKDYSGEQLQLITNDGLAILSSSFDTNCFYGKSEEYSAHEVAGAAISNDGEVYNLTTGTNDVTFNKDLWDTNWSFNKAAVFNGNKSVILSVAKWKDYSGEQLQIITPDGLVANLCSYNSKLFYDENSEFKADNFAQMYVGTDGSITDLAVKTTSTNFNYAFFDTKFGFNKAIILKDETAIILPIEKWCDYEGEQLQLQILGGPTIVTAAYDTILINDIESKLKANDLAASLASTVKDYSAEIKYDTQITFNGTILDLQYGFSNGILSNDNTSAAVKLSKWNDYEGEQLQIDLPNGDILLTSSVFLDLINGGSENLNASELAANYVSEKGKVIDKSNGNYETSGYNTYIIDTQLKFNYALKVVNGNVTIIPLQKWQDFANTDGNKDKADSPNCEQLQLILPEGTAIVTTAYDTILVKTANNIMEIAEMFRSANGVITDLTPYVGEPNITNGWNFSLFDTRYHFDYAIFTNDSTSQVFPLKNWKDFSEGEQLQLNFFDDAGFLTSFVNTTLVSTKTEGLEETLASAFNGTLTEGKKLVKIYE